MWKKMVVKYHLCVEAQVEEISGCVLAVASFVGRKRSEMYLHFCTSTLAPSWIYLNIIFKCHVNAYHFFGMFELSNAHRKSFFLHIIWFSGLLHGSASRESYCQHWWWSFVAISIEHPRQRSWDGGHLIALALSPIIMEVENDCIWKVTTIGGTNFLLPWLWKEG